MLTAALPTSGQAAGANAAPLDTCLLLDVDRTQELLSLCAHEGHPLILSGKWVQQQCGLATLQGPISGCAWGQGQLTLHIGSASLSWHEQQVSRTEWRRWREPLGLRHGLRLLDAAQEVALHIGAPLRSPHCEGALWRAWMDWIADIPVSLTHRHTA
ncbi:MAG: hypothetical protein C4K60_02735 [Ideonella sp. MAG2]|nr:MAG: hypothetical protein C4K60_02735 [Ideonella sp. MAG2]